MKFIKEEQLEFLTQGNYLRGQKPEERYQQIVDKVAYYNQKIGYSNRLEDRIKDLLWGNILQPSTPVLANFGRQMQEGDNTQPLSCSCNIVDVGDSIDEIYSSNHEVAMLSKLGAGVGIDFCRVREEGSYISEDFFSNSKLDWIETLVDTSQKVSQNAVRRGYSTPFIRITDKEYEALLNRIDKSNPDEKDVLLDNTVGIKIPKGFMKQAFEGCKQSQGKIGKLLKLRKNTGKVYIVFEENLDKNKSPVYEILGHEPSLTNICCVTGDQFVATEHGFKTVKQLSESGQVLKLFDNESVHQSSKMLYRGFADVYKIDLANGLSHTITSNHEVVVQDSRGTNKLSIDTGLSLGDCVSFQTNKGVFGSLHDPKVAFVYGLFLGDGNNQGTGSRISIWEKDFDIIPEVQKACQDFYNREGIERHFNSKCPEFIVGDSGDSGVKRQNLCTSIFNTNCRQFSKGCLPEWLLQADEETVWQFIRGLLYADGTVGDYANGKSFGNPISLSLTSINLDILKMTQLLFLNLGLNAKIYDFADASIQLLPKNDGTGDLGEYMAKKSYRLVVCNKNDLLTIERNTNFLSRKNVVIEDRKYRDNTRKFSPIISIEHLGKKDVYCPTVDSEKHLWVCNGIVTSNTEAITPSYPDLTFACILSAINLVHWDIITDQNIRDIFMFMDIIVEDYIDTSEGIKGLEKARKSAMEKRDIGLSVLGFHDLLQRKGFAFGDLNSRALNKEIFSRIRGIGDKVTIELGDKLSPSIMGMIATNKNTFEMIDTLQQRKFFPARRNVSLMMVAPHKSTSAIAGMTSGGIEPFKSNYYVRKLAKIEHQFKNPNLQKVLKEKGKDNFETWQSIMKNQGSVQHLDFLSDKEKDVFKTFAEISPKDIIDLASDRQKYIDMGQSLNLVFRQNYSMKDIYQIHKYAFEKDIKTLYYAYPDSHAALSKAGEDWDSCAMCAD